MNVAIRYSEVQDRGMADIRCPLPWLILLCGLFAMAEVKAADGTPNRQAAEVKYREIRTQAVMQIDGDFFREEKFTPEQVQLFITTRLAAEDEYRESLRQTHGTFLPSMLAKQMDASFAKTFSPETAQRYRAWVDTRLGWQMIWSNPILKAKEWLTFEEQDKLARAWGPLYVASMDVTLNPKFEKATREEKHAAAEHLLEELLKSAAPILDSGKLAELKKRLNEMRLAGRKEMDAVTEWR